MANVVYWEGESADLDKLWAEKQARERKILILHQIESILEDLSPNEKETLRQEIDQKFDEALGWYQILTH